MGVWIEIFTLNTARFTSPVTPCVGVWIEIDEGKPIAVAGMSLPAWECGLKCKYLVIPL